MRIYSINVHTEVETILDMLLFAVEYRGVMNLFMIFVSVSENYKREKSQDNFKISHPFSRNVNEMHARFSH